VLKIWLSDPFRRNVGSTGSAISRLTKKGRLTDLDNYVQEYISPGSTILDVAISTGVTSVDLYNHLTLLGCQFNMEVSDPYSRISRQGAILKSYRNEFGSLFCHTLGPIVFSAKLKHKWFFSKYGGYILDHFVYKCSGEQETVLLIDDELQKLLTQHKIAWVNLDIFVNPALKQYNFVRMMNLLNVDLFDNDHIKVALGNVFSSLIDGGILLAGRTNLQGINHATFFRKNSNKFVKVKAINRGSELEPIILAEF